MTRSAEFKLLMSEIKKIQKWPTPKKINTATANLLESYIKKDALKLEEMPKLAEIVAKTLSPNAAVLVFDAKSLTKIKGNFSSARTGGQVLRERSVNNNILLPPEDLPVTTVEAVEPTVSKQGSSEDKDHYQRVTDVGYVQELKRKIEVGQLFKERDQVDELVSDGHRANKIKQDIAYAKALEAKFKKRGKSVPDELRAKIDAQQDVFIEISDDSVEVVAAKVALIKEARNAESLRKQIEEKEDLEQKTKLNLRLSTKQQKLEEEGLKNLDSVKQKIVTQMNLPERVSILNMFKSSSKEKEKRKKILAETVAQKFHDALASDKSAVSHLTKDEIIPMSRHVVTMINDKHKTEIENFINSNDQEMLSNCDKLAEKLVAKIAQESNDMLKARTTKLRHKYQDPNLELVDENASVNVPSKTTRQSRSSSLKR